MIGNLNSKMHTALSDDISKRKKKSTSDRFGDEWMFLKQSGVPAHAYLKIIK